MPFEIPENLPPELYALAWLVGDWRGEGTVGYPNIEESAIVQDISFSADDDGPYLAYRATTRLRGKDGAVGQVWHSESGYWRPVPGQENIPDQPTELEVMVADPAGTVTVYVGQIAGPRVNLASDLLARTATAAQIESGSRMYGMVQSDLLWTWDIAAFGQPLQSYMSARLSRAVD